MVIKEIKAGSSSDFEWTEPTVIGVSKVVFDVAKLKIDSIYQNRNEEGSKTLTKTKEGFIVNQKKAIAIAEHFMMNAHQGVSSERVVPPLTVGIVGEGDAAVTYLIGGHGRGAGLLLAQSGVNDGMAETLLCDDKDKKLSEADKAKLTENLSKLQIRKYQCANIRDLHWLASLENSDSQHGERLTPKERRDMITELLEDDAFAQYRDLAFAIKFLGDSGVRGTVRNVRKAMWKDGGKTPYENGELDINGTPSGAKGAGTQAKAALNSLGKRLNENFDSLVKIPIEERDDSTYKEFEKLRKLWDTARKTASRWIQFTMDDSRTQEEHLLEDLKGLDKRIGYTEYQEAKVAKSQAESSTDEEASEEAKAVAENLKAEMLGNMTQNTPPNTTSEEEDAANANATPVATPTPEPTPTASVPTETPYAQKVGKVAFYATEMKKEMAGIDEVTRQALKEVMDIDAVIEVMEHAVEAADAEESEAA